jgi:glycosyltransferase involved in cell wall biosynthesis
VDEVKVLFTHRYFWPDSPPYASMLRDIVVASASAGYETHVFASMPSYRKKEGKKPPRTEVLDGVHIHRCWVINEEKRFIGYRLINAFLYSFFLFFMVIKLRPKVVTAATFPPVVAAWTASLSAKFVRAKFVYHMQDIHPEVSKYSESPMGRGSIFKFMRYLDTQTLKRASAIVVLSKDMSDTVLERTDLKLPVYIINNFSLVSEEFNTDIPKNLELNVDKKRMIFAGNLGKFQNLDTLSNGLSVALDRHPNLEILFLGDGVKKSSLLKRWQDNPRVIFSPFIPFETAGWVMKQSDFAIVSLSPEIYKVSFPSKVLTYAMLGLPMLTLVESSSKLAQEINDFGIGKVPISDSADDIADAVDALIEMDATKSLENYVANVAKPKVPLGAWVSLLKNLEK